MKRLLVLGGTGMTGYIVILYLESFQEKYIVDNVCYRNKLNSKSVLCDIKDINKVTNIIDKKKPDVIINCIGVLNKTAEIDIKNTLYVNAIFHKFFEKKGNNDNIKIIHISTDCVFSRQQGNYKEDSEKDEKGIYGLSKSSGEIINNNDLTFRASIIGPEIKNCSGLFHWFMQ